MDAMAKRTTFLREVLKWDGAPSEIQVVTGRAEELARETSLKLNFNLVTARSFGPPAVTAECAARFLQVGGYLIVSEPPNSDGKRWDSNGLAKLGLRTRELVHCEGSGFQILEKVEETGPDFPRGNGIPARKPLF
jgi:16S rRNA (guanine527-N7)-methyltransferase